MATASSDKVNKAQPCKTKPAEKHPGGNTIIPPVLPSGKWWHNNKYITWFGYFLLIVPVIIYFSLVNKYALNIPFLDDYNAILEFLTKFKAGSLTDKFALLFSQHSDHRIFHARVIFVLYYYIFGKINFIHLIFLANLQLVVIYILFIHFTKKAAPKYWIIPSLIIGFCLFDSSSYENADYAMCGITNYGVLMLFMVSLFCYKKTGYKFLILAGLFEAICIFSSGSGLICALSLVVFTLLCREKIKSITSASVFIIGIPLYYFHYQKMTETGRISDAFTSTRDVSFFFHMIGNHFSFEYGVLIGICEMALIIMLLPANWKLILKLKFKPETLPLISILCVLIGTSLSISVFRSNDARLGELASYASRYLIYTHMLAAVLFILLWIKIEGKNKFWYLTTIPVALILLYTYCINSEYGKDMMAKTQNRLAFYSYYYKERSLQDVDEANKIATEACNIGIYCINDERKMAQNNEDAMAGVEIKSTGGAGVSIYLPPALDKYLITLMDTNGIKLGDTAYYSHENILHVDIKLTPGNYILQVQNNSKTVQKGINVQ